MRRSPAASRLCGAVPRGGHVNFAVFFSRTRGSTQCNGEHDAERLIALNTTPAPDRARLAEVLNKFLPELNISFSTPKEAISVTVPDFSLFNRRLPLK